MDTGNDKELERLKDAMEQARALYDSAKLEFERARALSEELGLPTRMEAYVTPSESRTGLSVSTEMP